METARQRANARYCASEKGRETRRLIHQRYRQRRRAALNAIKLERGCTDCGYREHPDALQFDHVPERGEKSFNVTTARSRSWDAVLLEIEKCDVVCANCHAIRTARRRDGYTE